MTEASYLETLVLRSRAGDREALEQLLTTVHPDLQRLAAKVCRSGEDAEDAVQETLLVLTSCLSMLRAVSRFTAWSFAVVRNQCRQTFRRWFRETTGEPPLGTMPAPYREVFILRELEGLSGPEAAATLGITVEACKMRLHRARE